MYIPPPCGCGEHILFMLVHTRSRNITYIWRCTVSRWDVYIAAFWHFPAGILRQDLLPTLCTYAHEIIALSLSSRAEFAVAKTMLKCCKYPPYTKTYMYRVSKYSYTKYVIKLVRSSRIVFINWLVSCFSVHHMHLVVCIFFLP